MTKSEEWDRREKEITNSIKYRDPERVREIFFRAIKFYEEKHQAITGCNAVKINIGPDYTLTIFYCQICGRNFLR